MGKSQVCLLRGHGITVTGGSIEEVANTAVNLEVLYRITLDLHRIAASEEDLAELPDLGAAFNYSLAWDTLVARAKDGAPG